MGLRRFLSKKMRYHGCCRAEQNVFLQRASFSQVILPMSPFSCALRRTRSILVPTKCIAPLLLFTALLAAGGWAKDQPLSAIVLYDTANGAAYEQVDRKRVV